MTFCITFSNVTINKISSVPHALFDLLHVIASNTDKDWQIDLNRMNTVIQRLALRQTLNLEKTPLQEIVHTLVSDILYEKNDENVSMTECSPFHPALFIHEKCDRQNISFTLQMYHRLNLRKVAVKLASEPLTFWTDLLKRHLLNGQHAVILGYPWKDENKLRSHFESERICQRMQTFGDDGLQQKADILKKASEENEVLRLFSNGNERFWKNLKHRYLFTEMSSG